MLVHESLAWMACMSDEPTVNSLRTYYVHSTRRGPQLHYMCALYACSETAQYYLCISAGPTGASCCLAKGYQIVPCAVHVFITRNERNEKEVM